MRLPRPASKPSAPAWYHVQICRHNHGGEGALRGAGVAEWSHDRRGGQLRHGPMHASRLPGVLTWRAKPPTRKTCSGVALVADHLERSAVGIT